MDEDQRSTTNRDCPATSKRLEIETRQAVDEVIRFALKGSGSMELREFEDALRLRLPQVGRLLVMLFLAVRQEQFDLAPYQADGWRVKKSWSSRSIKTVYGVVSYGRTYLQKNCRGWFPLDAALGITTDGFSWCVIGLATRLATRMSYAATQSVLKAMLGWSPSTEAIEALVVGLGRKAPAFMATQHTLENDGEVLVIEVDGKAAPMATDAELDARRQKRTSRRNCCCRCQRHRGEKQRTKKPKHRKKRGHNSKNGRSAMLLAMYTLRRGEDGRLHGPVNKKVWGQFRTRKAAMQWAHDQSTRRGFPPESERVIQIVIDGERCLRKEAKRLFPRAILTLDLRHAQERIWKVGRLFHGESCPELANTVNPLLQLLQQGKVTSLVKRLKKLLASVPLHGPNTKVKRETLTQQIAYFDSRREIMRYNEYQKQDLVLATGVVEGACRNVVGERLDCSGMRWKVEGAEPLLQLRCIELNGDWEAFIDWCTKQATAQLCQGRPVKIRSLPTGKPPPEQANLWN